MSLLRQLTIAEQTAAHLRTQLERGLRSERKETDRNLLFERSAVQGELFFASGLLTIIFPFMRGWQASFSWLLHKGVSS